MIKNKGLTLVELLAVIVILAVIAMIAVPQIMKIIKDSREKALDLDAKTIQKAATRKLVENPDYDFSIIDADNIEQELNVSNIKKTKNNNNNAWTWRVSKKKHDKDYYLPAVFKDYNTGKLRPYVLVGKYNASENDGKLESKSGVIPLVSTNIVDFRSLAQDSGYQLIDIHTIDLLQTLFTIEFATVNSDSIMRGYTAGYYSDKHIVESYNGFSSNPTSVTISTGGSLYRKGQLIDIGTATGDRKKIMNLKITDISTNTLSLTPVEGTKFQQAVTEGDIVYNVANMSGQTDFITSSSGSLEKVTTDVGRYSMKYRGIENLYGNVWQWIDGINIKADHQAYVSANASGYTSNKFDDHYEEIGYTNATTNNYVLELGFDKDYPYVNLPKTVGESGSSPYKDYYYQSTGNRVARFGGSWHPGTSAGMDSWSLTSASGTTDITAGSRFLKTAS